MGLKNARNFELFLATHPVEYINYLAAKTASTKRNATPTSLTVQGVKKAFFYAPSTRPMFVSAA